MAGLDGECSVQDGCRQREFAGKGPEVTGAYFAGSHLFVVGITQGDGVFVSVKQLRFFCVAHKGNSFKEYGLSGAVQAPVCEQGYLGLLFHFYGVGTVGIEIGKQRTAVATADRLICFQERLPLAKSG